MSFLSISGLKKTYESLEGEISRTFDSTATAGPPDEPPHNNGETSAPSSRENEVGPARGEGGEEDWGEWEEQDGRGGGGGGSTSTGTTASPRGVQLLKKKETKKEPSPSSSSSLPVGSSDSGPNTPTPLSSSTPAKPGGKLDTLPRGELVKYIKKQAQLLQKSKARRDELSKECSELKKLSSSPPPSRPTDSETLMEELQVVRGERDKAVGEQRTLQQTITSLEQDKQTLGEQVAGMEKKVKQLQSEEEDWRCRDEVAATRLSAQQQETQRVKTELEGELASLQQELKALREGEEGRREREGERVSELQREIEELRERLEKSVGEVQREREEVVRVREEMESVQRRTAEEIRGEVERERGEKAALEAEMNSMRVKISEATQSSAEERGEVERLRLEVNSLQDQLTCVNNERERLETKLSDSRSGLETAHSESKSRRAELERTEEEMASLTREHERVKEQVKTLEVAQDSLQMEFGSAVRERESLHEECRKLHAERDELHTAKESLQRDLERERETHRTEREGLAEKVKTAEEGIVEAERLLAAATSSVGGAIGDGSEVHSDVVEELEWKIQSLESRLASVSSEKETLLMSSESVAAESETLVAQLSAERKLSEEREVALASLKSELEECRRKVEGLEGECVALRTGQEREAEERGGEVQQLREEVQEVQRGKEEAERELESVREMAVKREQETLQRSLEEQASAHKEETKKLKGYIVKMKKELADLRGKMAAVPSEGRDELQRQVEELRASVEAEKQRAADSEARRVETEDALKNLREELGSLHSERDGLQSSLVAATEEVSTLCSELSAAQSDLVTFQTQVGGAQRAADQAEKEAGSLREELERERETHSATKQKLTAAVKEAKVSSVMNLELADYQRSLQALEERLATAHAELEQAKEESRQQQDKMDAVRKEMDLQTQQCISVEDKLSKTKALWMKTKKELDTSRKKEGELQGAIVSLNAQLEGEKQLAEQSKAEMSTLTAKLQSMQQQSDSSVGVLQKTVRSLEHKLAAAQNSLTSSQLALSQCQQDYNSYKVRVHSVLKQKSSAPSPAEISTEIRQKFETEIIQLRADLQDSKSQLSSALAELEEVSEEHQLLSSKHTQLMNDSQLQLTAAKKKLEEAESRYSCENREQAELIEQLRQEVIEVTEAFRGQLHSLQEDHGRAVSSIQSELELSKKTVAKLQQEADAKVLSRASNHRDRFSNHTHLGHMTSHDLKLLESVPSEQRSSGEGMDQAELDSNPAFSPSPLSRDDSQLSFERLLSRADSEGPLTPLPHSDTRPPTGRNGPISDNDPQVRRDLTKAKKTIRGLNELLRESEEATVRLGEQLKLLKEEIRRLERNKERVEGVSNMEYLKNVVLKFLHSSDSAEQSALIPVISQLLRLSPQEMRFLQDTIKGTPVSLPDASSTITSPTTSSGLAGYVHRWTGY